MGDPVGATTPHTGRAILAAALLAFVAGCATAPRDGAPPDRAAARTPPPPDAVPRREPRSKYGNGPFYEVNGQRYEVMASSSGYRERGVASWYGEKFHGRPTSSQEPYDMHAMTAAHKTLPLPTYVEVRNLANGRSVVVRVNDRGPFVDNRIIDLSYAAARKLDMIRDGTGLVEVTALGFEEAAPEATVASTVAVPPARVDPGHAPARESLVFLQVGAFGDPVNARRRHELLRDGGIAGSFVHEDGGGAATLYRVRIGPIGDVTEYDSLVARLQRLGIDETHLVTE